MPGEFLSLLKHAAWHFQGQPGERAWPAFQRKMAEMGCGCNKKPQIEG
jgi:hypothetical protein